MDMDANKTATIKIVNDRTDRLEVANLYTLGGWCKSERAALRNAKKLGATHVIHSPGDYMHGEAWIAAKVKGA